MEDEYHVLFECPTYHQIRLKYEEALFSNFGGVSRAARSMRPSGKVSAFMNQNPRKVAAFVSECLDYRRFEASDLLPYATRETLEELGLVGYQIDTFSRGGGGGQKDLLGTPRPIFSKGTPQTTHPPPNPQKPLFLGAWTLVSISQTHSVPNVLGKPTSALEKNTIQYNTIQVGGLKPLPALACRPTSWPMGDRTLFAIFVIVPYPIHFYAFQRAVRPSPRVEAICTQTLDLIWGAKVRFQKKTRPFGKAQPQ